MKLLFITQKVDKDDAVLGFIHRWLEVFAPHFDQINVICLYKGRVELDPRINVFSLGKEDGRNRFKYIYRFYKYIWQQRKNYDAVFVHMNAEYVLLGFWLWKLLKKKVAIWYNHTFGSWRGKTAFALASIVFHTSPYAFSAGLKKSIRMPAGIDTELFVNTDSPRTPNSLLYIGRISEVKHVDVLVTAATQMHTNPSTLLDVYGSPGEQDQEYYTQVQHQAAELLTQQRIVFAGPVPNYQTPAIYNQHQICVNLTPRGNYDKTILEAMACGCLSVVSSEAFRDALPETCMFNECDSVDLADKLTKLLALSELEKENYRRQFRDYVVQHHALDLLAKKVHNILNT